MFFLLLSSSLSGTFVIEGDQFVMDGKPFRYASGSFHYFRQHPGQWEDTIKKMAVGGLNAIQTYVAWNIHEPQKGTYNWEGLGNLPHFLELCQKYKMYVLLRPGPYICAEWEFGGFPYWLLNELTSAKQFRSSDGSYLSLCDKWLTVLYQKIKPYLYQNGGPIIMVQIENEYGNFGCDANYMKHLTSFAKSQLGNDVLLYTTDNVGSLKCGAVDGAYATIDFGVGADAASAFRAQKSHNGHGPDVCSEYWIGWYDTWGLKHNTRQTSRIVTDLNTVFNRPGACINQYMYYGGTNFAFMNAASGGGSSYEALPTSYDYDGALSEAGDMTWKWQNIKSTIAKFRTDIPTYSVKNSTKKAYGKVTFIQGITLWDALPTIATTHKNASNTLTFEALGQDYGFIVYRTTTTAGSLSVTQVNDRAYVYVDQIRHGMIQRTKEAPVTVPAGTLDILVENMGRVSHGKNFVERKGLIKGVTVSTRALTNWEHFGFDLKKLENIKWSDTIPWGKPGLFRATFNVEEIGDTFLNPAGWTKGVAIVNGFNLGRYWTIGPQQTLYVPAPILKLGENELIIFDAETTGTTPRTMSFDATHIINKLQ